MMYKQLNNKPQHSQLVSTNIFKNRRRSQIIQLFYY